MTLRRFSSSAKLDQRKTIFPQVSERISQVPDKAYHPVRFQSILIGLKRDRDAKDRIAILIKVFHDFHIQDVCGRKPLCKNRLQSISGSQSIKRHGQRSSGARDSEREKVQEYLRLVLGSGSGWSCPYTTSVTTSMLPLVALE
jgi:hypothetical protein